MGRKAILVALSIALLLILPGCGTTEVSQEEYDAIMAGLNTVQDDIASLEDDYDALATELGSVQDDIATFEEEIENLRDNRVEEAWDRAQQRHTTIVQEIPFLDELEEMAPWVVFPDKPEGFDCARLCSMILDDDPTAYDAVCIVTIGTQEMYVRLSDTGPVTIMTCRGGTVDYEITITRNEEGKIIQEMMMAGESLIVIDWIDTGIEEIFRANVNGILFEAPWSEDPVEALALFSDLSLWLESIGMDGGLIKPPDQYLVIIALGELRQPPFNTLDITIIEILQRAVSDFMEGVPQTCM